MIPVELMHSPATINNTLRNVIQHYLGQPVVLAIHDHGSRKRSRLEGTIAGVTEQGFLVARARGGREYISFMDLYAGHIEITAPGPLTEDLGDTLAHLGVHHRQHRPVADDGRFGARPPVGPGVEGIHRAKTLVG